MTKKNIPGIYFILLLTASITLAGISPVRAGPTTLSLNPKAIEVSAPSQTFTLYVNVTDVTNLKGFEFHLWYNATLLNATLVSPSNITKDATKWLPVDAGMVFHWDAPPTINNTIGRVWIYGWGFTTFTGSGTLVTINFTAKEIGNCILHFTEDYLYDHYSDEISHVTLDGEVTVVPEFPTFIVMPLLLIATLVAAFLGKMISSRKRKHALTAE